MKLDFEIIKFSQYESDDVDYSKLIFKVDIGEKISIEEIKNVRIFLHTLYRGGALKFIIDMQKLKTIDSTGMGEFINFAKMLRFKKGDIAFLGTSDEILKIFEVVSLQKFIKTFQTEKEVNKFFRYV